MEVEILSKKLIRPSAPTPEHLREMNVSTLDQFMVPMGVPVIYYYQSNEGDNLVSNVEKSRLMQESLSELLTLFYPFAGRCMEEGRKINCNDEGVEYAEARVNCKLDQVINGEVNLEDINRFLQWRLDMSTGPQLTVQFNMFECGGLAIGFCLSHLLGDGTTMVNFFQKWATTCKEGLQKVDRPVFNLTSVFGANVPKVKLLPKFKFRSRIVTKMFLFSSMAISNLKAIANDSKVMTKQPSRVQVVIAFIWKILINISRVKYGQLRPSAIYQSMNLRERTNLPLSKDCCGNVLRPIIAKYIPDTESKMEDHKLVELLGESIGNALIEVGDAKDVDNLFERLNDAWKVTCKEYEKLEEVDVHMVTSWCGFPLYDADFGWGKPVWVSGVWSYIKMIVLLDNKDGKGIEAWISLEEDEMLQFQQDPEVKTFTS